MASYNNPIPCPICQQPFRPHQYTHGQMSQCCSRACAMVLRWVKKPLVDVLWAGIMRCVHAPCLYCCWPWQKGKISTGYGSLRYKGQHYLAHHLAYEVGHNRIIQPGYCACHHCDFPPCCNPEHLFSGTRKDNLRDAANKGRTTHGERHRNTSLTNNDVLFIRQLLAEGAYAHHVSPYFGVQPRAIRDIGNHKTWRRL